MKKSKTIISLFIALVFLFVLTSCSIPVKSKKRKTRYTDDYTGRVTTSNITKSNTSSKKTTSKRVTTASDLNSPFDEGVEALDNIFGANAKSKMAGEVRYDSNKVNPNLRLKKDVSYITALVKPTITCEVLFNDYDDDGNFDSISIMCIAGITDLNVDANWTRAMYDNEGNNFDDMLIGNVEIVYAYESVGFNGEKIYPENQEDILGDNPYRYFVVYTILDIPLAGYGSYFLDISLTISQGENSNTSLVNALSVNDPNSSDSFTYERGDLDKLIFEPSNHGNNKLKVKGNNENVEENEIIEVPQYAVTTNGRYLVDEVVDKAFEGFNNVKIIIPDVTYMGSNIDFNCDNIEFWMRSGNYKEEGNQNWHQDWNNGHNQVIWDYIGDYGADEYGVIYTVSNGLSGLYATAVGYSSEILKNNIVISKYKNIDVERIGRYVFNYSDVVSVVIDDCVKSMGEGAFYHCRYLRNVELGNGITSINIHAFSGDSSLTSIDLGNNINKIGQYAFYGCSSLASISIPGSVKTIEKSAFEGCGNINQLEINSGVETIEENAFKECYSLSEVDIPSGVKTIGNNAFWDCSNLYRVNIPRTVTSMGYSIFCGSNHLAIYCEAEEMPSGWNSTSIDEYTGYGYALYGSNYNDNQIINDIEYAFQTIDGITTAHVVRIYSSNSNVTIPNKANGYDVVGIGFALYQNYNVEKLTIPDTIERIIPFTFRNTYNLNEFVCGSGLKVIGCNAFEYSNLNKITLSNSLECIESDAFYNCNISSITLPESLNIIEGAAFSGCRNLVEVQLNEGIEEIGYRVFWGCSNLETLYIPDGVEYVDSEISDYNGKIIIYCDSIEQPNSWSSSWNESGLPVIWNASIDYLTYGDYKVLISNNKAIIYSYDGSDEDVIIPNTISSYPVTSISDYAFVYSNVESVQIPDSITKLGNGVFYGCQELEEVTIGNGITNISEYTFYKDISLNSITFGNSVTNISKKAFYGCFRLPNLDLPSTLKQIGEYAFYECQAFNEIIIPYGVTTIGNLAFNRCNNLSRLIIPRTVTTVGSNIVYSDYRTVVVLCETESKPTNWDEYWIEDDQPEYAIFGVNYSNNVVENGIEYAFSTISGVTTAHAIRVINPTYNMDVIIPENVNGYNVVSVGSLFNVDDKFEINSVVLPSTLTLIRNYAFARAYRIGEIDFGGTVTIQRSAFDSCKINTVILPNTVNYIGEYAFNYCEIVNLTIPNSITELSYRAFSGNVLTNLVIPSSITTIGPSAFSSCGIVNLTLPETVTTIESGAFAGCYNLVKVILPKNVEVIGDFAFDNCYNLKGLFIPASVTSITGPISNSNGLKTIYCEASTKPSTWSDNWNEYGIPVQLGVSIDYFNLSINH